MAENQSVLSELVAGFPEEGAADADYERAVATAVRTAIDAQSHKYFGAEMAPRVAAASDLERVRASSSQAYVEGMARVARIAGALDEFYPVGDDMPWQDVIECITLTDTDPRTGLPFLITA